MKKFIFIVAVVMVVALVFASIFGYKTNSFTDAFAGLEEVVVFVSSVSENALEVVKDAGNLPEILNDRWNEKWGATNYEMPTYYKRMCGDTTYSVRDLINKIFPDSGYPNAWYGHFSVLTDAYRALVGPDPWLQFEEREYICNKNTALALYYRDLHLICEGWETAADSTFDAFCRIEGKNQNLFNKSRWKWSKSYRQEFADKYCELLVSNEQSFIVYTSIEQNIYYYEFGKTGYIKDGELIGVPNYSYFNVKDYKGD